MKQIILLIAVTMVFSCKNEKKKEQGSVIDDKAQSSAVASEVIESLVLPGKNLWLFNGITFNKSELTQDANQSYNVARANTDQSAYTMVTDTPINYGSKYRFSLTAKKGAKGSLIGLRAVGQYQNRIDAVFDLSNGLVKGSRNSGDFIQGNASITPLGDGWYKCTIISELDTDVIKLLFGPTSKSERIVAWESKTTELLDIEIIPESLTLEEISE